MNLLKTCSKCKLEKSFESFSKSLSRKDGLYPSCKECVAEYNRLTKDSRSVLNKIYYEVNKEVISAKAKKSYSEKRDEVIVSTKKYREANREKAILYSKNYYLENKDKFLVYQEKNKENIRVNLELWRLNNIEHIVKYAEKYREDNRSILAERARDYYNTNKDKCNLRLNEYRKNNPEKFIALNAKRRANKLNATPEWLTKEHVLEIEELFLCARMFRLYTGQEYHVDHIIPLQGKNVCGLHVPWNLQVILAKENLIKSNKI